MIVGLTALASFIAGMIANNYAASTSIVRGDSIWTGWRRRALFGTAAMIAPWAVYFLVGGLIALTWST
ncbi:hypothetical protein ACVWZA_002215 [Sphingomonas sp. UYAg733]